MASNTKMPIYRVPMPYGMHNDHASSIPGFCNELTDVDFRNNSEYIAPKGNLEFKITGFATQIQDYSDRLINGIYMTSTNVYTADGAGVLTSVLTWTNMKRLVSYNNHFFYISNAGVKNALTTSPGTILNTYTFGTATNGPFYTAFYGGKLYVAGGTSIWAIDTTIGGGTINPVCSFPSPIVGLHNIGSLFYVFTKTGHHEWNGVNKRPNRGVEWGETILGSVLHNNILYATTDGEGYRTVWQVVDMNKSPVLTTSINVKSDRLSISLNLTSSIMGVSPKGFYVLGNKSIIEYKQEQPGLPFSISKIALRGAVAWIRDNSFHFYNPSIGLWRVGTFDSSGSIVSDIGGFITLPLIKSDLVSQSKLPIKAKIGLQVEDIYSEANIYYKRNDNQEQYFCFHIKQDVLYTLPTVGAIYQTGSRNFTVTKVITHNPTFGAYTIEMKLYSGGGFSHLSDGFTLTKVSGTGQSTIYWAKVGEYRHLKKLNIVQAYSNKFLWKGSQFNTALFTIQMIGNVKFYDFTPQRDDTGQPMN